MKNQNLTHPFESIDFELTDVTVWNERKGRIIFWTHDEVEAGNIPIKDILDFIEREQLNLEIHTINNSHDGNPCDDEDHIYEVDPIIYLENNFVPTIEAYYKDAVSKDILTHAA